jgi:hypothetical protein
MFHILKINAILRSKTVRFRIEKMLLNEELIGKGYQGGFSYDPIDTHLHCITSVSSYLVFLLDSS